MMKQETYLYLYIYVYIYVYMYIYIYVYIYIYEILDEHRRTRRRKMKTMIKSVDLKDIRKQQQRTYVLFDICIICILKITGSCTDEDPFRLGLNMGQGVVYHPGIYWNVGWDWVKLS